MTSQRSADSRVQGKGRLALACPVTTSSKGYPFEVPIPRGNKGTGALSSDQIKSLDWRVRNVTVFAHSRAGDVAKTQRLIRTLISDDKHSRPRDYRIVLRA